MIAAEFYIKIKVDGKRVPLMNTGNGNDRYLANLAIGDLKYSSVVKQELDCIEKVINGQMESHFVGYSDTIYLTVMQKLTYVHDGMGNPFFEPFEKPTHEIQELLKRWYEFLKLYEAGLIPGLGSTQQQTDDNPGDKYI